MNNEDIYTIQNMLNEIANSLSNSDKEELKELESILTNNGFELNKLIVEIRNGEVEYLEQILETLSVKYRDDTEDEAYVVLSAILEVMEMVIDPSIREEIIKQEENSSKIDE